VLILTRKAGEGIVVNGDVTIRVVEVKSNRIRLGIEAPSWMGIERHDSELSTEEQACRPEPFDHDPEQDSREV
jgi:carbon storage regulator